MNVFDEQFFQDTYPNAYLYLKQNQEQLFNRDKGKPKKYKWFEFGRSQAINDYGKKLLFPYMSSQPYFVYTNQEDLLLYAGYAIFCDSERELKITKRILESSVFWYYIKNTSKPYSGNFYALAKNYVKDFSICELTEDEENFLLNSESQDERNRLLINKYGLETEII
jgi:adenine-specific DNA-methyltransferase